MENFFNERLGGSPCDHVDGNKLDNRRENLRAATPHQNSCNCGVCLRHTSSFKGVDFHKPAKRWRALIAVDGKRIHLGLFDSREQAAAAYNAASLKYHGEYGRVNVITNWNATPDGLDLRAQS